jgi:periplasmic copper chaperone A
MKDFSMRWLMLSLLSVVMTAAEVTVSGAFARATAPSAANGAVFLALTGGPDALVSATSSACNQVELHTVVTLENGAKRMSPVHEIPIPSVLKPGGFHLMLMNLAKPLTEGETLTLTLTFTAAPAQTITVPILGVAAMSAPTAEPACCTAVP